MNDPLIEMLSCVTDCRREQAKRYGLANILLFCILGFFMRSEVLQDPVFLHRGAFRTTAGRVPIDHEACTGAIDPVADHQPG